MTSDFIIVTCPACNNKMQINQSISQKLGGHFGFFKCPKCRKYMISQKKGDKVIIKKLF